MEIRNKILAKQLQAGDAIRPKSNLWRVYEVTIGDKFVTGSYLMGNDKPFRFKAEQELEVVVELAADKLYFVGDRDQDFEWQVCKYLHHDKETGRFWFRSPLEAADNAISEPSERIIRLATPDRITALYLKYRGTRCPFCRSDDISNGDSNTDDNWHSISVTCDCCGATWDDVYTLNNVNDLEPPDAFK